MFKTEKLDYYKRIMLANKIVLMEFKSGETLEVFEEGSIVNFLFNPKIGSVNPNVIEGTNFAEFKREIIKIN